VTWTSLLGYPYEVQYTDDLSADPIVWTTLQTVTGDAGTTSYTDVGAASDPLRVYQIVIACP
jgi:hypothetical protein